MSCHDHYATQRGFTLIEIIATTVLLGIIAVAGGMFITEGTRGYITTRENSEASQKMDIAIMRLERELREVMDVYALSQAASESGRFQAITFERPAMDRAIALVDDSIKVETGRTLPTANTGHVLVDHITAFSLEPMKGDDAWTTSDPIEELSAIRLRLAYNHETAGALNVTTTIFPRNNGNFGGAPEPEGPVDIPDYCFVATAASGDFSHPMVSALRAFRDNFLLTWSGGQAFVDFYYTHGPAWAAFIKAHPLARGAAYIALLPLTGLALLLLWSPLAAVAVLCGVPLLLRVLRRAARHHAAASAQSGSVMLAVIGALVFMGIVGSAMVPMFSTSITDQAIMNQGSRSFYLAESGYAVAAQEFLNAEDKDATLISLHNKAYTLANNDGSFSLEVYPRWFKVSSVAGNTVTAIVLGGKEDNFPPSSGRLSINGAPYTYTSAASAGTISYSGHDAPAIRFQLQSTPTGIIAGDDAQPVALASSGTVTRNGSLTLATGASAFPELNGSFILDGLTYSYVKREGSRLTRVRKADAPEETFSLDVAQNSRVILDKFVTIRSTGEFGEATHQLTYNTPIGWVVDNAARNQIAIEDRFNNFNNFDLTSAKHVGSHDIVDGALKVTGTESFSRWWDWRDQHDYREALIPYSPSETSPINWNRIWAANGHTLTYDVQTKINIPNTTSNDYDRFFMTGINFRFLHHVGTSRRYSYCASLTRFRHRISRWDYISGSHDQWTSNDAWKNDDFMLLSPSFSQCRRDVFDSSTNIEVERRGNYYYGYSDPALILWRKENQDYAIMDYKMISPADGLTHNVNGELHLKPWVTLGISIMEGAPCRFTITNGTLKAGARITLENGGSAYVAGEPFVSNGHNYALLYNKRSFSTGNASFVNPDQTKGALRVLRNQNGATNAIRAFIADQDGKNPVTTSWTDTNRLPNPRDRFNWQPRDSSDVTKANDFFTLTQWNSGGSFVINDYFITQDWDYAPSNEVGLHAYGFSATNVSFDDFSIRTWEKGRGKGFRPPIMYSN